MMKLLLTAFEPFDGRAINASQEIVRAIQGQAFDGAQIELLYLPVERFSSTRILLEAIESSQPDVIILLGEAKGRSAVTPERVAINVDDYPIPDNGGNQPREETIVEGGPAAYFSTLPIVAIRDALNGKDVPATISNSAGTYLCNRVFYSVMNHLSQTGSKARAGFIHIPVLAEHRPADVEAWPSLPRETILQGIELAVCTCIQQHSALSHS
jgi:pyroglutamyl-peptidase